MKLSDIEILPGVVIDIDDPDKLGKVKADIPTKFDSSILKKEGMPWIRPIAMGGYQQHSTLTKGSKIWVICNKTNWQEYWYWPMYELNQNTRDLLGEYENADVLISRNMGTNSVYVYYNKEDGMMLKVGENSHINITNDGKIYVHAGDNGNIRVDNHVYIGDGKDGEPAVFGDKLVDLLNDFAGNIQNLLQVASSNPYTLSLAPAITQMMATLSAPRIAALKCTNTSVD